MPPVNPVTFPIKVPIPLATVVMALNAISNTDMTPLKTRFNLSAFSLLRISFSESSYSPSRKLRKPFDTRSTGNTSAHASLKVPSIPTIPANVLCMVPKTSSLPDILLMPSTRSSISTLVPFAFLPAPSAASPTLSRDSPAFCIALRVSLSNTPVRANPASF